MVYQFVARCSSLVRACIRMHTRARNAQDKLSLLAEERKLDEDIVRQNEQNKFLTARYEAVESYKQAGAGGKAGSAATPFLNEREVSEARAQRRLLEARSKNLQDRKNVLERSSDCCIKCWNACAPIRIAVPYLPACVWRAYACVRVCMRMRACACVSARVPACERPLRGLPCRVAARREMRFCGAYRFV